MMGMASRALMASMACCALLACQPKAPKAPEAPAGSRPVEASAAPTGAPAAPAADPTADPTAAPADPTAAPAFDEGTAEQLQALERANAAHDRGDEATALAEYARAAEGPITGASISATLAAAELLNTTDRTAEARALYQRAAEQAPHMAEIRYAAGRFFAGTGESPLAEVELREAIRLQPDFLPSYPALAGVLSQSGQSQAAAPLLLTYEQRLAALMQRLANPDLPASVRTPVIDLFALIDDDRVTRALIDALADRSPYIRLAAADALTFDPDAEALNALAQAVDREPDPMHRRALAASMKRAQATVAASLGQKAPAPAMPKPGAVPAMPKPSGQ